MEVEHLRYKIGDQRFAKGGVLGEVELLERSVDDFESFVSVPFDYLPSYTWEGTCERSRAAVEIAKAHHEEKQRIARTIESYHRNNIAITPEKLAELKVAELPAPFNRKYEPPAKKKVVRAPEPSTPSELQAARGTKPKRAADVEPVV